LFWFKNEFRKKGLRARLPKRNQKKGQDQFRKKEFKTNSQKIKSETKILEIGTQELLVLIFFPHFAQCLFLMLMRFHEKKYHLCAFEKIKTKRIGIKFSENGQDHVTEKKSELENSEKKRLEISKIMRRVKFEYRRLKFEKRL